MANAIARTRQRSRNVTGLERDILCRPVQAPVRAQVCMCMCIRWLTNASDGYRQLQLWAQLNLPTLTDSRTIRDHGPSKQGHSTKPFGTST